MIVEVLNEFWEGILNIQDDAYTDIAPEGLEALKSKWEASPSTCFVFLSASDKVVGYLLSYPWGSDEPPALFENHAPCPSAHTLYLHDLAVSQNARGIGIGKQLADKLITVAKFQQFKKILLVSVQGSERFWFSLGFREINGAPICSSYGEDAKLMVMPI